MVLLSPFQSILRVVGIFALSRPDLRVARRRFHMEGLCDVHHVIPRCCAHHPTLHKVRFGVEDPANFVLMPTVAGAKYLKLRPDRLIHSHNHLGYNQFVWNELDRIQDDEVEFVHLLVRLHRGMRWRDAGIPWKKQ